MSHGKEVSEEIRKVIVHLHLKGQNDAQIFITIIFFIYTFRTARKLRLKTYSQLKIFTLLSLT